jgi:polar amino acid transport system substrate-binding protein
MKREWIGWRIALALATLPVVTIGQADDRVPTGTLRVTYIATNPVQAFVDPKTGEVRGPGADMARAIAKRLGVPVKITGVAGPAGVLDSLKKGEADMGLLAFDPERAKEVDFSPPYALAQNTFLVPEGSALRSVADVTSRASVSVSPSATPATFTSAVRSRRPSSSATTPAISTSSPNGSRMAPSTPTAPIASD